MRVFLLVLALVVASCAVERERRVREKRNPHDKAGDMKKFLPRMCVAKRNGAGLQCSRRSGASCQVFSRLFF
jgi:hypothetical protein